MSELRELGIRSAVGCADHHRRAPVGRDDRVSSKADEPLPRGHRSRICRVHRARGDRVSERGGAGRGEPARGRAGRAAARGDGGRPRVAARRGVRRGRRGGGSHSGRRRREDRALRRRRDGDGRRGLGEPRPPGRGARYRSEGKNILSRGARTGRPARVDDYAAATGTIAEPSAARASAPRSAVRSSSTGGCGARSSSPREREPLPAGHRVADRRVHRAGRHRDREHRGAGRAHRVTGPDGRRGRRGAPARRARPARRRAAAARPHRDHVQAGSAGARRAATTRRSLRHRGARARAGARPRSCASSPTASCPPR